MKKLTYLLFLVIGVTSCSVESMDSTENLLTADAKHQLTAQETLNPMGFYSGGSGNLQGTFSIWNDCNNLYVQVTPNGDNPDGVKLGIFEDLNLPSENGTAGEMQYSLDSDNVVNLTWTFNLSDFNTSSGINVFINAWSDWAGAQTLGTKNNAPNYHIYSFDFTGLSCDKICPEGKGYWRNHSSDNPGEQGNLWPVAELMIGNYTYSQDELNDIMDVPNKEGNNLVIFSQQLIAAKLNVANGAGTTEIGEAIAEADDLIGDLKVLVDSFTTDQKTTANRLKSVLEAYNETECE